MTKDELISKQAVLDALLAKMDEIDDKPEVVLGMAVAMGMIKGMPSAQPKQRTERWIDNFGLVYCSGCGATLAGEKNYCPNCGAKMEVKNEN